MSRLLQWCSVVLVTALLLSPTLAQTNLLVDGGFESGLFPQDGWTLLYPENGQVTNQPSGAGFCLSGGFCIQFQMANTLNASALYGVSQTVGGLTAGASYLLSFALIFPDGGAPYSFDVQYNFSGQASASHVSSFPLVDGSPRPYLQYSALLQAPSTPTSPSITVTFLSFAPGQTGYYLDDVSLTLASASALVPALGGAQIAPFLTPTGSLLQNGDFESMTFAPFTLTNGVSLDQLNVMNGTCFSGFYCMTLMQQDVVTGITQTVNVTAGHTFILSFLYQNQAGDGGSLQPGAALQVTGAFSNGTNQPPLSPIVFLDLVNPPLDQTTDAPHQVEQTIVVPPTASTFILTINGIQVGGNVFVIDNVQLQPQPVLNSIIYMDYTSGFMTQLPKTQLTAVSEHTYTTGPNGSYRFGVDWNNDATDHFTLTIPPTPLLTVVAENDVAFCTPNSTTSPPNQITFTSTSTHQCNYTVSWTGPVSAVLTVTYTSGPNQGNSASDVISTFFQAPGTHGDPQFVGLRGQSYQVHGIDGAVYNLITDTNLQVNSRFVFLEDGECPVINGQADTNCWSHPGSYMGEMSFQQVVDGKLHAALLVAGDRNTGFSQVQVDGRALKVGEKALFGSFAIDVTSIYTVLISSDHYSFQLSNSDRFINQVLTSRVGLSHLKSHGLIGQTHSLKTYKSTLRFIDGEVDDYSIADGDIFGTAFEFNLFVG
jgi:hypothetical protein